MSVRTRFPPSPTGMLHVGSLRTALMNHLLAKRWKGTFVMRIEDTDRARTVPGAVENFLTSMAWVGIRPDEGVMMDASGTIIQRGDHGPYYQSERLPIYKKYAEELLASGHAYHCFCTPQRLEEMRKTQEAKKQAPMYDRQCLRLGKEVVEAHLQKGTPHVIRMKIPHERTIIFTDDIRGEVRFQGHTIDDQILLKSDGFPTYHLAHVVDDHLMECDIVIRGEEWLSSLPKHLLLFEWFNWKPPRYAHVPLLLGKDRKKLSKRDGDVAVQEYIEKGYLPEAMVNFLTLLGWNPGTTQEIFSMDELITQFSMDRVQKAGAIFDVEKLDWLQGQWIRRLSAEDFAARILPFVAARFPAAAKDKAFAAKAMMIQSRVTLLSEAADMLAFVYEETLPTMELLANPKQKIVPEEVPQLLKELEGMLTHVDAKQWTTEELKTIFEKTDEVGRRKLLWILRAALTGKPFSPGAFEVAAMLGKEASLKRISLVLNATS